jgi:hypothetical protein
MESKAPLFSLPLRLDNLSMTLHFAAAASFSTPLATENML